MTPEQKRSFNTGFGTLFIALGLAAWGFAAYYTFTPATTRPAPTLASRIDLPSCARAVASLGFTLSESDKEKGTVKLRNPEIETDAKLQMLHASLAATTCKMNMESFCMGDGCAEKGITMVLAPSIQDTKRPTTRGSGPDKPDKSEKSSNAKS